jgi:hypothetical protein
LGKEYNFYVYWNWLEKYAECYPKNEEYFTCTDEYEIYFKEVFGDKIAQPSWWFD